MDRGMAHPCLGGGDCWGCCPAAHSPTGCSRQPTTLPAVVRQPEGLVPFSVSNAAYWYRGVRGEVEKSLAIF